MESFFGSCCRGVTIIMEAGSVSLTRDGSAPGDSYKNKQKISYVLKQSFSTGLDVG